MHATDPPAVAGYPLRGSSCLWLYGRPAHVKMDISIFLHGWSLYEYRLSF